MLIEITKSERLNQIHRVETIQSIKELQRAIRKGWCVRENKNYLALEKENLKILNKHFGLKENDMLLRGME